MTIQFDATMTPEEGMNYYLSQLQAMVDLPVDILVTNTDTDATYLMPTSGDIPIVFTASDDPVATGAVKDLTNPGGLVTGIITNKPHERRLQILTEIKPSTKKVLYMYSPLTGEAEINLRNVKAVAEELNVEVVVAPMTDGPSGIEALKNAPDDIDWLFLTPFVPFDMAFFQELDVVSKAQQAGIAAVTDTPLPGYVMGYGPNVDAIYRQSARIVDRILRGASPADLPVETAENFLMVNLEAAEVIKLDIPVSILRQANLIIRPGYFEENPLTFGG
jgi:putative ABC transport system substrate-binding protein